MKLLLQVGESLFKCNKVAELPIVSEAEKIEEVYGTDTFRFDLYCKCDDPLIAQFLEIQRYRYAQVVKVDECDGRTIENVVFRGYISKRNICTKPKQYKYEIELTNFKGFLKEVELVSNIDSPQSESSPSLSVLEALFGNLVLIGLLEQMNNCLIPLSFCLDSEFNLEKFTGQGDCGTDVYSYIDNMSKEIGALRYIETFCRNDNVLIELNFTECIGQIKTDDPNSYLVYNGKGTQGNTINSFCALQTGGGVACVTYESTVDIVIGSESVETSVGGSARKGTPGVSKCFSFDNSGNSSFSTVEDGNIFLNNLSQEKLDELCELKTRYDINMGKNVIDANIGDRLRLRIQETKLDVDVDTTLTVLRVRTTYKNCAEQQEVTLGSAETPYVSISDIKQNLGSLL